MKTELQELYDRMIANANESHSESKSYKSKGFTSLTYNSSGRAFGYEMAALNIFYTAKRLGFDLKTAQTEYEKERQAVSIQENLDEATADRHYERLAENGVPDLRERQAEFQKLK